MGIPLLKIRRSWDRLIFNMGIPTLVRRYLYIKLRPPLDTNVSFVSINWFRNIHSVFLLMQQKNGYFYIENLFDFLMTMTSRERHGVSMSSCDLINSISDRTHITLFTEAEWRLYASENYTILISDNGTSNYLNRCWFIVNSTVRNKFQWNWNRNITFCMQKMNVNMAAKFQWNWNRNITICIQNECQRHLWNGGHVVLVSNACALLGPKNHLNMTTRIYDIYVALLNMADDISRNLAAFIMLGEKTW